MIKTIYVNVHKDRLDFIENSTTEEFINFAKQYNIFQSRGTNLYKETCDKIKARLDRESLSYDTVRPD